MTKHAITLRVQRFVDEYVADPSNATQAYLRAGYKCTAEAARRAASRLLTRVDVAALVAERQRALQQRVEVTQDKVVRELVRIAFADQRQLVSWGPDGVVLRKSTALSDEDAAAVAEVAQTVTQGGGSLRVKAHDKVRALELLGKHLGIFEADNRRKVDGTIEFVRRIVDGSDKG